MVSGVLNRPLVPAADRLALALCIAIAVHALLILGVSFQHEPPVAPPTNSLEVTLVAARSEAPPVQAEALAQSNSQGGGDRIERVRPSAPWAAPETTEGSTVVTPPPPSGAPSPTAVADGDPPQAPAQPVRTAPLTAPAQRAGRMAKPQAGPEASEPPTPLPTPTATPAYGEDSPALPTAAQLITRSFALASMNAELQDRMETRAHRPRQKFISASTQEYRYAAYMEAWRAKVERIGNINYPDEARQRELSGSLLLDVAIRPDGSVIEIVVRRTSGHKVLDDAAVRIVELAAPFAPFPSDIAREVDILHVTRTWRFVNNTDFTAQ